MNLSKAEEANRSQKSEENQVSERIQKIVENLKEKTAVPAYRLEIIEDKAPDIFDSKFGGVPYWDMAREYPVDSRGNKMMLLAQINFTRAALNDERLPKKGMLQFFIASEDDVFGMNFDQPDVQADFRVIFHEEVDEKVTEEQVLGLNVPVSTSEGMEYSPVFVEKAVKVVKTEAHIGPANMTFEEVFRQAVKEQTGEDIGTQGSYQYLTDEESDYLYNILETDGHRILGYPYFTQYDPRENMDSETADYYDTLLFQMDSEMRSGKDYVLWGDCGVANFFINGEALKNRDFSRVLYNWDCC